MKKTVLILALIGTASTASAWTEIVTCKVKRTSVDFGTSVESTSVESMNVGGRHNAETGSVEIKSALLPSYKVTLEMLSSGRSDVLWLKTSANGELQALSSINGELDNSNNPVENKFITINGDYEVTISCTTRTAG